MKPSVSDKLVTLPDRKAYNRKSRNKMENRFLGQAVLSAETITNRKRRSASRKSYHRSRRFGLSNFFDETVLSDGVSIDITSSRQMSDLRKFNVSSVSKLIHFPK